MNLNKDIVPYQFEPRLSDSEICGEDVNVVDQNGEVEAELEEKLKSQLNSTVESWCKCGSCGVMPTHKEHVCCHEIDTIRRKISDGTYIQANLVPRVHLYFSIFCDFVFIF